MNHPVLGHLEQKGNDRGSFEGRIKNREYNVGMNIELDTEAEEEVFKFAESVVYSLSILEAKAKVVIGQELLETYNSGWKEYDEVQDDGSTKTIVNPTLETEQFINHFELDSISICGSTLIEFWYKTNELFWGHSVYVTSFDGVKFEDTNVQMFG